MQSVSDGDVRKGIEKPCFELAAKGVFRLGRCYIFQQGIPGLWASNQESPATDGWLLDRQHQKMAGACTTKWPSARKTAHWHERSKVRQCTSVKHEWHRTEPSWSRRVAPRNQWWNTFLPFDFQCSVVVDYPGAFSTLLRELVAEFTLTDNPANTTTSLLRSLCHTDDSIILGTWLQETDHKTIEDQVCALQSSLSLAAFIIVTGLTWTNRAYT